MTRTRRDGVGTRLARARTLPGSFYADAAHHSLEMDRVFGQAWVGVGSADDIAGPGSYLACNAGRTPVLVVRDDRGTLRAFLNVCRHRGSPLAEGCGEARALACPYHGWVYRLDGSLARAAGVGQPEGFRTDDYGLREIAVTTFARSVLVNLDRNATPPCAGRLGHGIEPFGVDMFVRGRHDRYTREFNWKVLLENYAENYHTPFVHPELPVVGYEYPIEAEGPVVFAWDKPLHPRDEAERALSECRPGEPGWERVASSAAEESFNNGVYMTLWPNTMLSVFAGFAATFRIIPTGPTTTVVERDYLWHPGVSEQRRQADYEATVRVVEQDLAMCEAVQRTYTGGCSADGVLSTEHEQGVAHLHQLLLQALGPPDRALTC
jgi:phenylpropionate dioxygenase-like ring-hydroxylating dioxygenase large terminal subunit